MRQQTQVRSALTYLLYLTPCVMLCAACGAAPPKGAELVVELVVDPRLNSSAQLLSRIQRLELVLATAGGFTKGNDRFRLEDRDGDRQMELIHRRDVAGDLPSFRLFPSAHTPTAFRLSIFGYAGDELMAGGMLALRRSPAAQRVRLPFNLLAKHRPLRVLNSIPGPRGEQVSPLLSGLQLLLSRKVEGAISPLQLTTDGGGLEARLLARHVVEQQGVAGQRTQRSLLTFTLCGAGVLAAAHYQLVVTKLGGMEVDQDASTPAADAFLLSFYGPDSRPGMGACQRDSNMQCERDPDCFSATSQAYVCARDPAQGSTTCLPKPASCDEIVCGTGATCREQSMALPVCESCQAGTKWDPAAKGCVPVDRRCDPPCATPKEVCDKNGPRCIVNPACPYTPCQDGSSCDQRTGECISLNEDCRNNPLACAPPAVCDEHSGRCIGDKDCRQTGCGADQVCNRLTTTCEPLRLCDFECPWPFRCDGKYCRAYAEECWQRCISISACEKSGRQTAECQRCLDGCG